MEQAIDELYRGEVLAPGGRAVGARQHVTDRGPALDEGLLPVEA